MEPGSTRQLIALFVLLLLSAFFSMSETALISLNKIRLRHMVEEDVKNAALVESILKDHKKLITSILIGNNLANIGASSLATLIAVNSSGGNSYVVGISTGVLTFLILIFGEITPKTFASQNSEKISIFIAKPVKLCVTIFSPFALALGFVTNGLINLFGGDVVKSNPIITEDEFKTIVNVSHEEGVLEIEERRMINNVFDFGDFSAKDLMTPRTDIVAISVDSTFDEINEIFKNEQFSRMPVYRDSTDDIVGILYLKDFVFLSVNNNQFNIEECMRKPYFTYESKPASQLFLIMRTKRIPVAIVLDEYGGTSGLITLEDLIEEIVGDIEDEYDDIDKEITCVKEDEYIVAGGTKITDVNDTIGTKLESDDFDSIGGYVMGVLGRIPITGDIIETNNIKLIIEEIDKNRIAKLRIHT